MKEEDIDGCKFVQEFFLRKISIPYYLADRNHVGIM